MTSVRNGGVYGVDYTTQDRILLCVETPERAEPLRFILNTKNITITYPGDDNLKSSDRFDTIIMGFIPIKSAHYTWYHSRIASRNVKIVWTAD